MTRVYGGCVEPEGWDLEERRDTRPCPRCEAPARSWFCEHVEGGAINVYVGMHCPACGHEEGDDPDDGGP